MRIKIFTVSLIFLNEGGGQMFFFKNLNRTVIHGVVGVWSITVDYSYFNFLKFGHGY